eukprot:scaffold7007_cov175-Prasinococcus_capsulatus_cf.AAC.1
MPPPRAPLQAATAPPASKQASERASKPASTPAIQQGLRRRGEASTGRERYHTGARRSRWAVTG